VAHVFKRANPMATLKKILIGVDASEAARRAVSYVIEMFGATSGLHVGLVHVELPPRMLEWGGSEDPATEEQVSSDRASAYRELEKGSLETGRMLLQNMQSRLAASGIDVAALTVTFDEPLEPRHIARDLLKIAKERDYATVVVGRNSFSKVRHFFQHHVGEELVRTSHGVSIWVVE
jgi:nucleotide-binding universal stress UspA family protein